MADQVRLCHVSEPRGTLNIIVGESNVRGSGDDDDEPEPVTPTPSTTRSERSQQAELVGGGSRFLTPSSVTRALVMKSFRFRIL